MDYSLVQALKYAATDLGFGRLLDRLVSKQATLTEDRPVEGHFHWLQEIRKVDPTASGDSVGHLHAVAKVLAGTADHSTLPASLHSDNSPLGQFLKSRLKPKEPVPTGQSPLEPLSLSVEPPQSPKALLPLDANARKVRQGIRIPPQALSKRPLSKD